MYSWKTWKTILEQSITSLRIGEGSSNKEGFDAVFVAGFGIGSPNSLVTWDPGWFWWLYTCWHYYWWQKSFAPPGMYKTLVNHGINYLMLTPQLVSRGIFSTINRCSKKSGGNFPVKLCWGGPVTWNIRTDPLLGGWAPQDLVRSWLPMVSFRGTRKHRVVGPLFEMAFKWLVNWGLLPSAYWLGWSAK